MERFGKALLMFACAMSPCFADAPRWITKDNCYKEENRGIVVEVKPSSNADLVVIDTGLQSNLRIGAVCFAQSKAKEPARVVIVEASEKRSVGLVITNTEIEKGAVVYITAN